MGNTDWLIARRHVLLYQEPSVKLLNNFLTIFWLVLFAYIQVESLPYGNFHPFSLLILAMPFVTKKLLYRVIDWRAANSVKGKRQKTEFGYFVEVTDSAKDGFTQLEITWLDGMHLFLFVKEDDFEERIAEWEKNLDFDFVENISMLNYMSFTVLNEDLIRQLQSLCSECITDSRFDFPITKKCFARYVIANKMGQILDSILLEVGNV